MTPENKNLVVGLVVGFAWGLVVCSLAHADLTTCKRQTQCEQAGPGICTSMNCNVDAPTIGHSDVHCAPGYASVLSGDRQTCAEITIIASCEQAMAEAMRAMQRYIPRFVDPAERRRYRDAPRNMTTLECVTPWCGATVEIPDTRTLAEKLRDVQREYERHQEILGRQIVEDEQERWAYRQWDAAKACWMPGR